MSDTRTDDKAMLLLIAVLYEGPWERAANRLYRIRRDGTLSGEVRDGSMRARLATAAERADFRWRRRHVTRGTYPAKRWKRRP